MGNNRKSGSKDWQIITKVRSFLLSVSEGMTPDKALESCDSILDAARAAGMDVDGMDIPTSPMDKAMFLLNLQRQMRTAESGIAPGSKSVMVCFSIPSENVCKDEDSPAIEDTVTELLFFYNDDQSLRQVVARSVWRNKNGIVERAAYEFSPKEAMQLEEHFCVREVINSKITLNVTTKQEQSQVFRM